jgi:hypothetical protein
MISERGGVRASGELGSLAGASQSVIAASERGQIRLINYDHIVGFQFTPVELVTGGTFNFSTVSKKTIFAASSIDSNKCVVRDHAVNVFGAIAHRKHDAIPGWNTVCAFKWHLNNHSRSMNAPLGAMVQAYKRAWFPHAILAC